MFSGAIWPFGIHMPATPVQEGLRFERGSGILFGDASGRPPVIRRLLIIQVPDTSGKRGMPLMSRPIDLMVNALNALGEGLFQSSAIYLHAAPMFHLANGAAMYSLLLSGGSNIMIQGFTPEGVMAAIQSERVTDALLVPTMIQMLVDHPAIGSYDLSSLKHVIYGASPISDAVLGRAMAALPNVEFTQAYGMTELAPIATLLHWKEHIGEGRAKGRHRAAGRATLGCEVRQIP